MNLLRRSADFLFLAVLLVLLIGLFSALSDHFWSLQTFNTVANRIPPLALAALGMTFVLIAGGIDLSVGSVSALAGAVFGWLVVDQGAPIFVGFVAALAGGLACGAFNGMLVNLLRMPSFIVTLGLLEGARGLAYLATDSQTKYLGDKLGALQFSMPVVGVSFSFVLAVGLTLVAHFVMTRTVFGRHIVAVGTNEEASRLAGLSPSRVRAAVFMLAGTLAALAGLCHISRLGAADPNAGVWFGVVRHRGCRDRRHEFDGRTWLDARDFCGRVDHRDT
ncbi:MAG: ABC transporter permease [Magnetospirillum sp.]|nr:ABC transporter permease [Magnetospirillum sp.]